MDYKTLVASEFQTPKFLQIVEVVTNAIQFNTDLVNNLPSLFDLDTAVGQQLDFVGEWIGFNRDVLVPVTNVFFNWGVDGLGWAQGYWEDQYSSIGVTSLPDSVYRSMLYTKVALNNWKGDIPDIISSLSIAFPNNQLIIFDNQDMTMTIGILGHIDVLTQSLITSGYFDIRPAGVKIEFVTSTTFFAWGLETADMRGWDEGNWYTLID